MTCLSDKIQMRDSPYLNDAHRVSSFSISALQRHELAFALRVPPEKGTVFAHKKNHRLVRALHRSCRMRYTIEGNVPRSQRSGTLSIFTLRYFNNRDLRDDTEHYSPTC
ncbi:hypothetical protein NPIL_187541 [Nephila pilipes]|uniref:Uncharacterized protein n=1 Tax=Nephila pilipes TaxID=299642 RepID=A0A8X6NDE5_NEPPI|nr:hypothetical protein NPIL_187541 [Nephila pilipes]